MMEDEDLPLLDMLWRATRIAEATRGADLEQFTDDFDMQDVVLRSLHIIGEAASRIDRERRERYPEVEWNDIISMRHVVVHDYDGINYEIVWAVVEDDIPALIKCLEEIVVRKTGDA